MKLLGKFLIAALVIAFLLPFTILKGKDGKPLMSFSNIKAPSLPELPDSVKLPQSTPAPGGVRQDVIYQWRDEKGELHFTSEPPPAGIKYTAKGYDPKTNLIQSVKIQQPESTREEETAPAEQKKIDIGNPYSPEKVEKLIEDAQNIQKLLNDRIQKQEAMIGQ